MANLKCSDVFKCMNLAFGTDPEYVPEKYSNDSFLQDEYGHIISSSELTPVSERNVDNCESYIQFCESLNRTSTFSSNGLEDEEIEDKFIDNNGYGINFNITKAEAEK